MSSIKGYSAKQIAKVMKHIGTVWQDERYERIVRNEQDFQAYWQYIPHSAPPSVTIGNYG